jgi:hypothetical protein
LSWFGSVDASNITSGVGTINMRTEALNYRSELKGSIPPLVRDLRQFRSRAHLRILARCLISLD